MPARTALSDYRFGIEEEYFVVDRRTGGVRSELSKAFMRGAKRRLGDQLMNEILQSQIEVATLPCTSPDEARVELRHFRATLSEVGRAHGLGIVAAGTHPLARIWQHRITPKRRYVKVIDELGIVGTTNALCGLHVHVEMPDPARRVDVMRRIVPFLPILLALSTSSPFWDSEESGLLGYRNAANDALPRTGFPEEFRSVEDYEAYVQALVEAKIIENSTFVWWALRPSLKHPTLELRLTDCCTAVDDAIAIASLYRALVRHLFENPGVNEEYSAVTRALTEENRWRAQRYGIDGKMVDWTCREAKPFRQMLEETLALVEGDVAALGLEREMAHLRAILRRGTSAHRQIELYRALRKAGRTRPAAMRDVARWLRAATEAGDLLEEAPASAAAA
jgi:carboxylate-amine ligase